MKKILITGGGGFIGTHLAENLCRENQVVIYDNLWRNSLLYVPALKQNPYVTIVQGDVLDGEKLEASMEGVDIVIHMAAIAGVSNYYKHPTKTLRVNIFGTVNVLEAMLKTGAKQMIDFSTSEVYGVKAENVDEESPHGIGPVSQQRWVYAVSKLASEHFTLRYGEEFGLKCTNVRPFNIYGPRQTGEGAISNFARALIAGKPITIYGDGMDVRAWCYVSDMVEAVDKILNIPAAAGKAFNIGNTSQPVTTRQLAETAIKVFGKGDIEFAEREHAPIMYRSPDLTRAREILGYEPQMNLEEGLKKTIEWFQEVEG